MEEAKGADTKLMAGKVNASCWELLGMGRGLKGATWGDCWGCRWRVGEVMRPPAYASNDCLIVNNGNDTIIV